MSDHNGGQQTNEAEMTSIPVRGDCGHAFPVPLARLLDGAPFTCPSCGLEDHIDQAALDAAEPQLRSFRSSVPPSLQVVIDDILVRAGKATTAN